MTNDSAFQDKNVLITGGLGFIGSNLAHALVQQGADVTLVDSLLPDYGGNLFNIEAIKDNVTVHFADIRSQHSMQVLVKNQDYIFNMAGQTSHIDSMTDPYTDLEINCRSQLSLLEAVRHNSTNDVKIVYASTRQIYGKPLYLPIDEKHLLQPTDVNGINKMAGEWYHILYHNIYGIKTCSLRITNTFGPRQLMKHNRQGFIPWFIRLALEDKKIQVYQPGTQLRDINYIDDVVDALLLAASSPQAYGNVYNLGHHEHVSLLDFVEVLINAAKSGSYELIDFPPEKKMIDVGSTYCDYSRIKRELGWEPKTSLRVGLEQTLSFYRDHKKHYW